MLAIILMYASQKSGSLLLQRYKTNLILMNSDSLFGKNDTATN